MTGLNHWTCCEATHALHVTTQSLCQMSAPYLFKNHVSMNNISLFQIPKCTHMPRLVFVAPQGPLGQPCPGKQGNHISVQSSPSSTSSLQPCFRVTFQRVTVFIFAFSRMRSCLEVSLAGRLVAIGCLAGISVGSSSAESLSGCNGIARSNR